MPTFDIVKKSNPKKTFRVADVCSKFSLKTEQIEERFVGDINFQNLDWQIGVIIGNSGTGKTTIAKELFGDLYFNEWEHNSNCVLDDFDKSISNDEIFSTLNSVGFSSPPSWLKPYFVLSNGEKMRCDLANAILSKNEIIIFDEFTSVVDRNIAKIASYAVQKSIKRTKKKFIAISCHYDILEWIEPDWVFDTNEMKFSQTRGLLRRPEIELKIYERKGLWGLFRKYHYLNHEIANSTQQFVGFYNNEPVSFCAVMHFPHPINKKIKRCTRLVVLPDFQGIGIGNKTLNFVAEKYKNKGFDFRIVTSTPALIHNFKNSKNWKLCNFGRHGNSVSHTLMALNKTISMDRITTSWKFVLCS